MKSQLENIGRPRRSLGQNFAIEPRLLREIAARVAECRSALEVGSGLGVLSAALAERVEHVTSIEIDARFTPVLREIGDQHANIDFVVADALMYYGGFDCVASNLPYFISGPFLAHLVKRLRPVRAVLTLQKEVAARLVAKPGTSSYGRITVLVNLVYDVELGGVYPPSSFYPPPEVYSRIVVLKLKPDAVHTAELELVERVSRCLFSQRNKRAFKVVKSCCSVEIPSLGNRRVFELTPREVLGIAKKCKRVEDFGLAET